LPHLQSEKDVRLRGLRCSKCHDFFRGQVFGCTKNHATCSLCCGVDIKGGVEEDVEVDGQDEEGGDGASNMDVDNTNENTEEDKQDGVVCPMADCNSKANISCVGKNLTRIVGDLRLKIPCKNRDAGCPHKCVEDEMEEHEDECGDRKVNKCDFGCENIPFKDLFHHLRDEHEADYETKKWLMCNEVEPTEKDEFVRYGDAYMFETGPDGLVFITDVIRYKDVFRIAVRVMGGKQVAKKYRVELRVTSNKSSVSLTHNGPVFPIEDLNAPEDKESFEITWSKFAFFNYGKEYFGLHNEDKNGEIVLPLSVKIEKKQLGLSTD